MIGRITRAATALAQQERAIWVLAGAIHLLFWVSLKTYWLCPLFNDSLHRFGPGADFFALYQAGYNALHGLSIYSFVSGHTVIPYAYPFRYLPASAFTVGALLSIFRPESAYVLWLGVCELVLVHNVRVTYRLAGGGARGTRCAALWLVFVPYFLELWVGQFTFILGSLLFWSVLAAEEQHYRRSAGWWIVSVLWKPASLLWGLIWLKDRRYWWALGACGALLAVNLLYFRWFPADWQVFTQTNLDPVPTWHAGNIGLSGLIYYFCGKGVWFRPVRMILTVGLFAPAAWLTLRRASTPLWVLAGLWTSLYFLIYKDVWEHHVTMVLPFLVLAMMRAPSIRLGAIIAWLALPSPFFFYDVPGLGFNVDPQPFFSPWVSLLHHSWRVIPLALLYVEWLRLAGRLSVEAPRAVTIPQASAAPA